MSSQSNTCMMNSVIMTTSFEKMKMKIGFAKNNVKVSNLAKKDTTIFQGQRRTKFGTNPR